MRSFHLRFSLCLCYTWLLCYWGTRYDAKQWEVVSFVRKIRPKICGVAYMLGKGHVHPQRNVSKGVYSCSIRSVPSACSAYIHLHVCAYWNTLSLYLCIHCKGNLPVFQQHRKDPVSRDARPVGFCWEADVNSGVNSHCWPVPVHSEA